MARKLKAGFAVQLEHTLPLGALLLVLAFPAMPLAVAKGQSNREPPVHALPLGFYNTEKR